MGANAVLGSNGKVLCRNLFVISDELTGEEQRVAVRLGIGGRRGSHRPAGAAAIVDDDALPEAVAQRLAQNARHRVGRASRRGNFEPPRGEFNKKGVWGVW